VSDLTDEQNNILLALFDTVHDAMHVLNHMSSRMEEDLYKALKILDPDPLEPIDPDMDNVIPFPQGELDD
jgi:hypothetical protein